MDIRRAGHPEPGIACQVQMATNGDWGWRLCLVREVGWAGFPWCVDLAMAEACCTVVSTRSACKIKKINLSRSVMAMANILSSMRLGNSREMESWQWPIHPSPPK